YMTTLGGQSFADAYAKTYFAVAPTSGNLGTGFAIGAQPFFESALGGPGSAYCAGYANCTSAVGAKNAADIRNTSVSNLWIALTKANGWTLPRSMISAAVPGGGSQGYTYIATDATGYGNYNALFLTHRFRDSTDAPAPVTSPGAARWVPARRRRPPVPIPRSMSTTWRTTTGRRITTSSFCIT